MFSSELGALKKELGPSSRGARQTGVPSFRRQESVEPEEGSSVGDVWQTVVTCFRARAIRFGGQFSRARDPQELCYREFVSWLMMGRRG